MLKLSHQRLTLTRTR